MGTYLLRIMQEIIFKKKVSKGSRFNQIYVPKEMENIVDVGDLVQVRLLKKYTEIYYKNQKKLSDFKEYLIKNIFSGLQRFTDIKAIFIVGSFLYETIYNDIDIILIINERRENFEKIITNLLTKNLNQKFHVLLFNEKKLKNLIEKDPLTRSMFNNYISNKKIKLSYKKIIDKKHIKFLLMMPEDLLELKMPSKIFYDNLRRLITIEQFLKNKEIDRETILNQIKKEINLPLLSKIKENKEINNKEMSLLRKIIKEKINKIKRVIKNGQKR